VLEVFSGFGSAHPTVVSLAVREMPTSGKPAELLAAAGIDAAHIAAAVRRLVTT
jgi:transketolase